VDAARFNVQVVPEDAPVLTRVVDLGFSRLLQPQALLPALTACKELVYALPGRREYSPATAVNSDRDPLQAELDSHQIRLAELLRVVRLYKAPGKREICSH
jgi:hypothetical protein